MAMIKDPDAEVDDLSDDAIDAQQRSHRESPAMGLPEPPAKLPEPVDVPVPHEAPPAR